MSRTRVKICGITCAEDACAAAEYGADAVGIVRYPDSPRFVADAVAAEIVDALPAFVTAVMLFVNEPPALILEATRGIGGGMIQMHGDEESNDVVEIAPLRVIKAMRAGEERIRFELTQWQRIRPANLAGILLESPGELGGSGVSNDWDLIRRLRDENYLNPMQGVPIILAGGLTPQNVGAIVREFEPFAVDVSSGVEDGVKGVKSRAKMAEFIAAVREAA